MVDENINEKPYKIGDKLILEVIITNENKSFDFLGKAIMNKLDTTEFGFDIDSVCFWKDRYMQNIPKQLRTEITHKLEQTIEDINKLIQI